MDTCEIAEMLDRLDLAEVLHDAGEQPRPPPVRLRGTRLLARSCRARLARRGTTPPGHSRHWPAARVLPPIRTLTVGPGVPPGQPALRLGRGLSPPVRSFTDPGARLLLLTSVPHAVFRSTAEITTIRSHREIPGSSPG